MTLREFVRALRKRTIRECQEVIFRNPDKEGYSLSARLSDLKLLGYDNETETLIKEYKNETENFRCKTCVGRGKRG